MRNLNLFIMKCISIYFVTLLLLMSGCESGRRFILKDLRCENLENPVAIDNTHPHFSWKIETDGQTMRQAYFEIQVATDSSLSLIHILIHQPEIGFSYIVEVKYARWDASETEIEALRAEAAIQLRRYAADPKVHATKGDTELRLVTLVFKGWKLAVCEMDLA